MSKYVLIKGDCWFFILQVNIISIVWQIGQKEIEYGKSLIFNKKVYDEGPNIVVIGGGSGLDSVWKGLKNYTNNIIN